MPRTDSKDTDFLGVPDDVYADLGGGVYSMRMGSVGNHQNRRAVSRESQSVRAARRLAEENNREKCLIEPSAHVLRNMEQDDIDNTLIEIRKIREQLVQHGAATVATVICVEPEQQALLFTHSENQ